MLLGSVSVGPIEMKFVLKPSPALLEKANLKPLVSAEDNVGFLVTSATHQVSDSTSMRSVLFKNQEIQVLVIVVWL